MPSYEEIWNSFILCSRAIRNDESFYSDEDRARLYDASVLIWKDAEKRVIQLQLDPESSVLEIGPGPGVMTIPLAKRVKAVTVVEPSAAMIRHLKGHISDEKLSNITILHNYWENVSLDECGMHDIILASYCLDMPDIRTSLQKMCDCAKKAVHIWWFQGVTSWESIQHELTPERAVKTPKADILMGVLYEMGYTPVMEILADTSFPGIYDNVDDARIRMRTMLAISKEDPLPEHVEQYIETYWKKPDGGYEYIDTTTYVHITIPIGTGE